MYFSGQREARRDLRRVPRGPGGGRTVCGGNDSDRGTHRRVRRMPCRASRRCARLDALLHDEPMWTPPQYLSERVAVRAVEELQHRSGARLVSPEVVEMATNTIVVGVAAVTGARVFSAVLEPALAQSPLMLAACLVCLFLLSSVWLRRLGTTA